MNTVFLQLGSNMSDRDAYLQKACELITEEIGLVQKKSKMYWDLKQNILLKML